MKIFYLSVVWMLLTCNSVRAAQDVVHNQSFIVKMAPGLEEVVTKLVIGGITTWALSHILVDTGYRYLTSKAIARDFAQELRKDSKDCLREWEISFWSFIQSLSAVPQVWWREITATALLISFLYLSKKAIMASQKASIEPLSLDNTII